MTLPREPWCFVGDPTPPPEENDMNRNYLLAVLDRAVKTAAQSAILVFGADQVNALNADWVDVGGFAAGGFVLSVLSSLAVTGFTGKPSTTTERVG